MFDEVTPKRLANSFDFALLARITRPLSSVNLVAGWSFTPARPRCRMEPSGTGLLADLAAMDYAEAEAA